MIPQTLHATLWSLALIAAALFAFWRGGPPERLAITGVMVAHMLTVIFQPPTNTMWSGAQWGVIAANSETFLVALFVLAKSRRWWPIGSTALQGVSLILYMTPLLTPGLRAISYHLPSVVFDYLNLAVISAGVAIEGPRGRMGENLTARPPAPPPAASHGGG